MSQQQSTFRKKKRKNNFTKRNISHVRAIVFKKEKKEKNSSRVKRNIDEERLTRDYQIYISEKVGKIIGGAKERTYPARGYCVRTQG